MLADKERCYGCGACVNICPNKVITMIPDEEGFIQPHVDKGSCVNCTLCGKVCPANNRTSPRLYSGAYAIAANNDIRFNSASGAAFYLVAGYMLSSGGVVCGARYSDNFREVCHTVIESERDLAPLMSSKYVQSDVRDSFKRIIEALCSNRPVLFCGTPCQCAGLRKILETKEITDDNIIIIDLICHSVPSPKAWKLFIDETISNIIRQYSPQFGTRKLVSTKVINANQRSKLNGWQTNLLLELELQLDDGSVILHSEFERKTDDYSWWYPWLRRNAAARKTCYNCVFACKARQGDLTLGDFWGVDDIIPGINDGNGITLVFARRKGVDFINKIAKCSESKLFRELTYLETERAAANQKGLNGGWALLQERETFFSELNVSGFFSANKKLLNLDPPLLKSLSLRYPLKTVFSI